MTEARLASGMLIAAIRRLTEQAGGFATIIRRGDETSGAVILAIVEQGVFATLLERMPRMEGGVQWQRLSATSESHDGYLAKRLAGDPDICILELDVPDATRFIPLLPSGT